MPRPPISNPFAVQAMMYDDRVDIATRVVGPKDEAGGSTEADPVVTAADVPCYIEDMVAQDMSAYAAQGLEVQTSVFFPEDPSDLPAGTILIVLRRAGRDVSGRANLRLRRVETSSIGPVSIYRALCEGRT